MEKMPSIKLDITSRSFKDFFAIFIIFMLAIGSLSAYVSNVQAGTFTSSKVTISDSRASNASTGYNFAFTTTVTTSIKQVTILFCTTASGTCTTPTGLLTTGAIRASDNIAGTGRTDTVNVNGTLTTVITTPATQTTQAVTLNYTGITNPSTADTTFYTRITSYSDTGTTTIDSGTVAFAILTTTSVAVSASVDPSFTFTVAAVAAGAAHDGATGANTSAASTANTLPFGALVSATSRYLAQDLSVTTNATSGYTITVNAAADPPLSDSTKNIDKFTGTNTTPTAWSAPAGTAASVNTGFLGYTTNDATLGTGTAARFTTAGPKYAGPDTTASEIAYSATAVGSGEVTRVGWRAEVNGLQTTGSYTGTIVYVATPTY